MHDCSSHIVHDTTFIRKIYEVKRLKFIEFYSMRQTLRNSCFIVSSSQECILTYIFEREEIQRGLESCPGLDIQVAGCKPGIQMLDSYPSISGGQGLCIYTYGYFLLEGCLSQEIIDHFCMLFSIYNKDDTHAM